MPQTIDQMHLRNSLPLSLSLADQSTVALGMIAHDDCLVLFVHDWSLAAHSNTLWPQPLPVDIPMYIDVDRDGKVKI